MTAALEGGEWSAARPGRTLTPGKTRYPFYRRVGGPQDRAGRPENLDSIADLPARRSVTIPTELPDPQGTYRQTVFLNLYAPYILYIGQMYR